MFLLRKTTHRTDTVALLSSQALAIDLAKEFVDGDGQGRSRNDCFSGDVFRTVRYTESGRRCATVTPLALDDTDKVLFS